jgi:methionyl-tRNA synthetase
MSKKLVTSALPYANGYIHLGHLAGAYLPADIYVRFQRLCGEEVLYVCGSDEHGVAITIAAEKEGVSPKDIIDKYHNSNKESFEKFGLSFDIYSRTSNKDHHETAKEFFADFLKKGFLVKRESEQFFDKKANMFLPDRYVEGICPNCGNDGARGDQCDSCGAYYSQTELKNPISLVTKETPILKSTVHWYFKFQEFQEFLENYINENEKLWKDNVIQQTRSWLKSGLAERAITRDLTWGVDLNGIEGVDEKEAEGKRLYVWFDAVLGYISATKEYYKDDRWRDWWQNEDTDYLAFIGKDNIVFHTLIFPAMLFGRRDENNKFILPKNVPAHEFLNLEGQKFSKSKNWSIDLKDFINDHPEDYNIDIMRYALAMNFPETRDSDFTWKDFQARGNNELAAILGNFINRTLQFLHKNFEGKVPELKGSYLNYNLTIEEYLNGKNQTLDENDRVLFETFRSELENVNKNWNSFRFRDGIVNIMNIARAANKYFNDEEPWKSIKVDFDKSSKTLYVCTQLIRSLSILFAPVIPQISGKIQKILNVNENIGNPNSEKSDYWNRSIKLELAFGHQTNLPEILFPRIEDEFVEKEFSKLGQKKDMNKNEEKLEGIIEFSDFMNVKLKTAKIVEAENIKKSDKLIKLQVDLGYEKRQIVAGIAKYYTAEELIGKVIIIVANLKPAKLMGELSEGMILAANYKDGLKLATFDGDVELGAEVR